MPSETPRPAISPISTRLMSDYSLINVDLDVQIIRQWCIANPLSTVPRSRPSVGLFYSSIHFLSRYLDPNLESSTLLAM